MFTGLVREVGLVERIDRRGSVTLIGLSAPQTSPDLAVGDSLAVNGVCLTVVRVRDGHVQVEATAETRRVTTLAEWKAGDRVHLEPALRVGDRLGGHFVLGHVDGVGRIAKVTKHSGTAVLVIELERQLAADLISKGSIAVDGVSLTLDAGPFETSCSMTIIPHTLAVTRFGSVSVGDLVNLELDVLAKAAAGHERAAVADLAETRQGRAPRAPSLTLASLRARGWQGHGSK